MTAWLDDQDHHALRSPLSFFSILTTPTRCSVHFRLFFVNAAGVRHGYYRSLFLGDSFRSYHLGRAASSSGNQDKVPCRPAERQLLRTRRLIGEPEPII